MALTADRGLPWRRGLERRAVPGPGGTLRCASAWLLLGVVVAACGGGEKVTGSTTGFAAVSADTGFTCGVTFAGAAYCWGNNAVGELGDGTTATRTSPVAVSGGLSFAAISAGGHHTCGITSAGAAYCWGYNGAGELGDGTTTNSTSPVAVSGGLTFAAVGAGGLHSCGVTSAGAAYCWGYNGDGELGNGTTASSRVPVRVEQ